MNKLLSKYKESSAPLKASFWFLVCNVLQKGISVLCTPVFTRLMTTSQYGEYSVFQSWYSIISVIVSLNLAAGVYNNGLTKYSDDVDRLSSSFLGLSSTCTIFFVGIYLCSIPFWNKLFDMSTTYMMALFIQVLFSSAYNLWAARQRYDYKYRGIILSCIIIGIIGPILAISSVVCVEDKVKAMILSFVLVQTLVGLVIYISIMIKGKKFYNKYYWKYALAFNIPLIPHYLSQIVLNQADRIMIKSIVGYKFSAMYSVAYTISMVMLLVISAINNTLTPYIYKSIKGKKYKQLKKITSGVVVFVCVICYLAILCGPELVRILAAPEYYEARWVVPPVAASLFFIFAQGLFGTVEFYFEKTKFIMLASSIAALSNVAFNYIFIKRYGFIAAGYTTYACYLILMVSHYTFYKLLIRKYGIKEALYNDKLIAICSICLCVCMFITILIYDLIFVRYSILILILSIVFKYRKEIFKYIGGLK